MRNPWEGLGMPMGGGPEDRRDQVEFMLQSVLSRIHFPAQKETLIHMAEHLQVPEPVLQVLQKLSNRQYENSDDVSREAGMEH